MLSVGDTAPEIDSVTSKGTRFRLSEQSGLCTVVYFYPKAFTPGCTAETKRFRDNYPELTLAGATVIGVSTDDVTTQCNFAESLKAPFPLVPDADLAISRAYGVLWPVVGVARRVTFVIDPKRRVLAVFHHEIQIKKHRDDVLWFVHQQLAASRARP